MPNSSLEIYQSSIDVPKKNMKQQKVAENFGKIYFKSIEGVIPFNMINKRQIQRVAGPIAHKKLSI